MATTTQRIGSRGEAVARHFLENKGYRFVAANWSCRYGEIDLIMQAGSIRVLVEVRFRDKTNFGTALETIGLKKQRKLVRTVQCYQQNENYWEDIRFDVIAINHTHEGQYSIDHIEHAFTE